MLIVGDGWGGLKQAKIVWFNLFAFADISWFFFELEIKGISRISLAIPDNQGYLKNSQHAFSKEERSS